MVQIQIKYGESEIPYEIPERNLWEIVQTKDEPLGISDRDNAKREVGRAISNPLSSRKLNQIIKPDAKVVITQDDHTRGTPGYIILPPLLQELNACGVPDENITLIFACGTHRPVKEEEQKKLVGEEVLERVRHISHNCDASDLIEVGTTSRNKCVSS
jgi:nickel-dependent lactate racemase